MEQEEWRPVRGCPSYMVSDRGRVVSYMRKVPRELTGRRRRFGHISINLMIDGKQLDVFAHVLVAEAFIGPRPDGMQVRHLNGDPSDNRVENLAYGTPRENVLDAIRHGTHTQTSKVVCSKGHPFDEENIYRPPSRPTWRMCRICNRERTREYKQAKRARRAA